MTIRCKMCGRCVEPTKDLSLGISMEICGFCSGVNHKSGGSSNADKRTNAKREKSEAPHPAPEDGKRG